MKRKELREMQIKQYIEMKAAFPGKMHDIAEEIRDIMYYIDEMDNGSEDTEFVDYLAAKLEALADKIDYTIIEYFD